MSPKVFCSFSKPMRIFQRLELVVTRVAKQGSNFAGSMTVINSKIPIVFAIFRLDRTNFTLAVLLLVHRFPRFWGKPIFLKHFFQCVASIIFPCPLPKKVRSPLSILSLGAAKLRGVFLSVASSVFSFFFWMCFRPTLPIFSPPVLHTNILSWSSNISKEIFGGKGVRANVV